MELLTSYSLFYALFRPFSSLAKACKFRSPKHGIRAVAFIWMLVACIVTVSAQSKPTIGPCSDFPSFSFSENDPQAFQAGTVVVSIDASSCTPVNRIILGADLSDLMGDSLQLHISLSKTQDWGKGTTVESSLEGELLRIVIEIPFGMYLREAELLSFHVTDNFDNPVLFVMKQTGGIVIMDNIMGRSIQKTDADPGITDSILPFFAQELRMGDSPATAFIYDLYGKQLATFDPRVVSNLAEVLNSLPQGIYIVVDPSAQRKAEQVRKVFKN